MGKRDYITIIITLILLLIGTQIFHVLRYNQLRQEIVGEFCEQCADLSQVLADIASTGMENTSMSQKIADGQRIAYTLIALVNHLGTSDLETAQISELTMFFWQIPTYLAQSAPGNDYWQNIAVLSNLFNDFASCSHEKDVAAALYQAMHDEATLSAVCADILNYGE